jgi:mRNA interferase MazF
MPSILCAPATWSRRSWISSMRTEPGEVWLADLGLAAKTRPVLIISRADEDPPRALVIHVPVTTQNRGSRYEVDLGRLPFLREASFVNVQGIASIPTNRLERKLGRMSDTLMEKIKDALRYALDL